MVIFIFSAFALLLTPVIPINYNEKYLIIITLRIKTLTSQRASLNMMSSKWLCMTQLLGVSINEDVHFNIFYE